MPQLLDRRQAGRLRGKAAQLALAALETKSAESLSGERLGLHPGPEYSLTVLPDVEHPSPLSLSRIGSTNGGRSEKTNPAALAWWTENLGIQDILGWPAADPETMRRVVLNPGLRPYGTRKRQ